MTQNEERRRKKKTANEIETYRFDPLMDRYHFHPQHERIPGPPTEEGAEKEERKKKKSESIYSIS